MSARGVTEHRAWTEHQISRHRSNLAEQAMLRELRGLAGIKQIDIARTMGVHQSQLASWEAGTFAMSEFRQAQYRKAITQLARQNEKRARRSA